MSEPVRLQLDSETQKLVSKFNTVMADAVRTREMNERAKAALWSLDDSEESQ